MFFRWCGGCGSKRPGLMNMLEAQNTLVFILNPAVLNCNVQEHARVHFKSDCAKTCDRGRELITLSRLSPDYTGSGLLFNG